jgi:DNA repair protein RadD
VLPLAEEPAAEDSARGLPETVQLGGQNSFVATLPFERNQDAERALRPLRPYQAEGLEGLRRKLVAGISRLILQLPTGGGKTLVAAHIIRRARDKGKRVAFVVPALSLIDQTVAAFEAEGIRAIGVVQASHPRTDHDQPVQVCSIQTIARRKRPDVDLVIVDEAHQLHKETFRWMADCPDVPFAGLSATPWARGLGKYYDDLIIAATTSDLIRDGFLSPFVAFAPSSPDLSGVSTVGGEFHQGELGDAMDRPTIVGDIVETWFQLGENRPTLCYCVNRKHAQHVCERFVEVGITAAYMDGETPREERKETFDRFRSGETKIICNVGVLTTGIDLPNASCVIDAKPTKSKMLFVQTIGRGLRTEPGKDNLKILDHAGNHLRLGLVTDIGQARLDDGKERQSSTKPRERTAPLPRLCDGCKAVVAHGAKVCSCCGAPMRSLTTVRAAEGTLVELGSLRSGRTESTIADKAIFYAELKGYAEARGYADGWASHKYREKFKTWPNDPRIKCGPAISPSLQTRNWIKSRQIAFVKARGRAHG